jgi:hypothetical protein
MTTPISGQRFKAASAHFDCRRDISDQQPVSSGAFASSAWNRSRSNGYRNLTMYSVRAPQNSKSVTIDAA